MRYACTALAFMVLTLTGCPPREYSYEPGFAGVSGAVGPVAP